MTWRLETTMAMALALAAAGGCNPPTACDCGPTGATISVPAARAAAMQTLAASGPCTLACEGDAACTRVRVEGSGAGTCHVEIAFRDGAPWVADIELVSIEGDCCNGYYAVDGRDLAVPPAETAPDAACGEGRE